MPTKEQHSVGNNIKYRGVKFQSFQCLQPWEQIGAIVDNSCFQKLGLQHSGQTDNDTKRVMVDCHTYLCINTPCLVIAWVSPDCKGQHFNPLQHKCDNHRYRQARINRLRLLSFPTFYLRRFIVDLPLSIKPERLTKHSCQALLIRLHTEPQYRTSTRPTTTHAT